MLVVATGSATRFGGIAAALAEAEPPSAFERGMRRLGLLILRLTVFLVLFVLLVNIALRAAGARDLPVRRRARRRAHARTVADDHDGDAVARRVAHGRKAVVVKRLAAIHDLGAMDVLCTDKTGTLTEAKIIARRPSRPRRRRQRAACSTLAAVNCELRQRHPQPARPGDDASIAPAKIFQRLAQARRNSVRFRAPLRVGAGRKHGDKRILILKGAPEAVLARASAVDLGDGQSTAARRCRARRARRASSRSRPRSAIGCSRSPGRTMPADAHELRDADESELTIAGLLHLRRSAEAERRRRRRTARRGRRARQGHFRRSRGGGAPSRRHAEDSSARPADRRARSPN